MDGFLQDSDGYNDDMPVTPAPSEKRGARLPKPQAAHSKVESEDGEDNDDMKSEVAEDSDDGLRQGKKPRGKKRPSTETGAQSKKKRSGVGKAGCIKCCRGAKDFVLN